MIGILIGILTASIVLVFLATDRWFYREYEK